MVIITIDTAKDSKDDLRKIIDVLKNFTEETLATDAPDMPTGAFGLFDNPPTQEKEDDDAETEESEPAGKDLKLQFY